MKYIAFILLALLGLSLRATPSCAEGDIVGFWQTDEEKSTVEITRTEEGWLGRIIALINFLIYIEI
jgi:hypothetical protein